MFITDSSGNKSLTATIVVIGFVVTMLKVLLNGASITIGSSSYSFGTIDSLAIAAILTPLLGSYTVRRLGTPAPKDPPTDGGSKPHDGAE